MGIFDFVRDAGEKLTGADRKAEAEREEATQERRKGNELMQHVVGLGFTVDGLRIDYDDGTAVVKGKVPDQSTRERVVLAVGNTQGVARVDDRMEVSAPAPEAAMYTVRAGDSLSKIAKAHYGDARKYPAIFEANQPLLKDPNKIYPGQVLRIPPVEG